MNPVHNLKIVTFPRFIAGLGAVCWHFILNTNFIEKVEPFQSFSLAKAFILCAPIGMGYFYALSGFVLAAIYYKPGIHTLDYRHFFLMRLARIYPIFLLSLVFYLAMTWPASSKQPLAIALNTLLVQAWVSPYPLSLNYPAWTLSVELFFYVMFPFLVISFDRFSTRKLFVFTGVIWLISNLLQFYYTYTLRPPEGTMAHDVLIYFPPLNLNGFLIGMLGGICLVRHGQPVTSSKLLNIAMALFCVAVPIALTLKLGREVNVGGTSPFIVLMMYIIVTQRTRLWDWMSQPRFEALGHISYAMCILQVPLFIAFMKVVTYRFRMSPSELFYSYFALLMVVSYVVYYLYEAPFRDWVRQRLKEPRKTKVIP